MSQVSYNQLEELTGRSYRVIKKRLEGMKPVGKGKAGAKLWDSREALNRIYSHDPVSNGKGVKKVEIIDAATERGLLAKAQRVGQEIKNAKDRGELIPLSQVKEVWIRIVTAAKIQLLALPDRIEQRLGAMKTKKDRRALIEAEVKKVLHVLSKGGE